MGEQIRFEIGQFGCNVAPKFWEKVADSHSIDYQGCQYGYSEIEQTYINKYFIEGNSGRYIPRTILFDFNTGLQDQLSLSPQSKFFDPDGIIVGDESLGNNWAKGHYTIGTELIDIVLERTRKNAEKCDLLGGFEILHSTTGGTGSGFSTLLFSKLREEYPSNLLTNFCLFNSDMCNALDIYNEILSMHILIENSDSVIVFNNDKLTKIYSKQYSNNNSNNFNEENNLIAEYMNELTSTIRFPGLLNTSFRKLYTNLTLFPRLHFFLPSLCPLSSNKNENSREISEESLINDLFSNENLLCNLDITKSDVYFFTLANIFRGDISTYNAETSIKDYVNKHCFKFKEWIPNNVLTLYCNTPRKNYKRSCVSLANSNAIRDLTLKLCEKFTIQFRKKSHLHWYLQEGMDEMEFTEAESNCNDFTSEFIVYTSPGLMGDEEEGGEDEL